MKTIRWFMLVASVVCLCAVWASAQGLEEIADAGYQPGSLNPGDSGLVQRVRLRDQDLDRYAVVLQKVWVENLGTARADDIAWVRISLNVDGRRTVLAEWDGFPARVEHLTGPIGDRTIPDDGTGHLEVRVGTTSRAADGRTIRTRVTFWYAEGPFGDSAAVEATHAAVIQADAFTVRLLQDYEGGVLNPGDTFVVARIEVIDDAAANFQSVLLTSVRVDGPGTPLVQEWVVDSKRAPARPIQIDVPGAFPLPDGGLLAALDRSSGIIEVRGRVGFEPPDESQLRPTVTLELREGEVSREFTFTSPVTFTVREAGFEILENKLLARPRQIFERRFQEINHSTVFAKDQDLNQTPVTINSVRVASTGTAQDVSYIEVWDENNVLLGVAYDWGEIELLVPGLEERPPRVSDGGETTLRFVFAMGDGLPLGASLLTCKELTVKEIHPALITPTRFEGTQKICDKDPIFFGRPEIRMQAEETTVRLSTDGETIRQVVGVLRYTSPELVTVAAVEAVRPYRVVSSEIDEEEGLVAFTLEVPGAPQAGRMLNVTFARALPDAEDTATEDEENGAAADEADAAAPGEEEPLEIQVTLDIKKLIDTAGIELPFNVPTRTVTVILPVPEEDEE